MQPKQTQITSARFVNYKAFKDYSASFRDFNVLVGPNNAGKSTILGSLRILSEAVRKARSRNPEPMVGFKGKTRGYSVDLRGLPVSTENVFHNYNDSEPAVVTFRISNGNQLTLWFPEKGACCLFTESQKAVRSTNDFKREFPLSIAFVPVLGPVDHNERLNEAETARRALFTHNASRNFRNIWYHFPGGFQEFRTTIKATWPGMDIDPPEIGDHDGKTVLHMFCPEERFPRELFWAGFGFQVWCQLLTFILRSKDASLLIIDEPDIYLHSDLQRQLVHLLGELGPAIVIATHSTEIISEVEPDAILNVNKRFRSARRIQNSQELDLVFSVLGSNLNPTLTQLAKTKRVVFVEGKDFVLFARFARKLGIDSVANRSHFAVVSVGGFNPQKVKDFSAGMELTLGVKLIKTVIFDRDYRCTAEASALSDELNAFCWLAVVHKHKEIENYLLHPTAMARAIRKKSPEKTASDPGQFAEVSIEPLLLRLTESMKNKVQAQLVTARQSYERRTNPTIHPSNISEAAMNEFDDQWNTWDGRVRMISGKEALSMLNRHLQNSGFSALTPFSIIDAMSHNEVPNEMILIINKIAEMKTVAIEEPLDYELS
jgi:energy-coupling factor transporter ATP-binding protein EcfA2